MRTPQATMVEAVGAAAVAGVLLAVAVASAKRAVQQSWTKAVQVGGQAPAGARAAAEAENVAAQATTRAVGKRSPASRAPFLFRYPSRSQNTTLWYLVSFGTVGTWYQPWEARREARGHGASNKNTRCIERKHDSCV